MAVKLENSDLQFVDFGRDAGGMNVVAPFPAIYRYEQIIEEVAGYDPHETGEVTRRVHYGYSPHPVIKISNVVSSHSTLIRKLDFDADGAIWLLCHRHRSAAESAAYAHAVMMSRNPGDGLAPAAIEYVTDEGYYTIAARRPPKDAPSGLIVYSVTHDDVAGPRILSIATDPKGSIASAEAHLFSFVPLPDARTVPKGGT
ncbi:hypothetical protein [Sphingomonas sp. 3-13AW]|uniref:hypothetical protein n=1 Tax=Sphingomonas sp. 3-13AW TaxID=3050450 RepID=UPI003BB4F8B5